MIQQVVGMLTQPLPGCLCGASRAFSWACTIWLEAGDGVRLCRQNGEWSDAAIYYGRALSAMNHASRQIAALAGTEDMMHYISYGTPRKVEERRWGMRWRMITGKDGKCIILRTGEYDYTVLGVDTLVTVCPVVSGKSLLVEEGRWHEGQWMVRIGFFGGGDEAGRKCSRP